MSHGAYKRQCLVIDKWKLSVKHEDNLNRNTEMFCPKKPLKLLWVKRRPFFKAQYINPQIKSIKTLQWRHNVRDIVSNHQPHDCLLNRLFRRRSKKTLKLRVIGLFAGNSPGTGEFPAQRANDAENVSIWWRHHEKGMYLSIYRSVITCQGLIHLSIFGAFLVQAQSRIITLETCSFAKPDKGFKRTSQPRK